MNRTTSAVTTLLSGVAIAGYLLLRPYGDAAGGQHLVEAFASPRWVPAHLLGAAGLVLGAATVWLLTSATTRLTRLTRISAVAGAALVLPYYGAESFALHALAVHTPEQTEQLAAAVRDQPWGLATFGAGLLLLALAGLGLGRHWWTGRTAYRWAAWPFGLVLALFVPQFYLPPTGRMTFGVLALVAALILAAALLREATSEPDPSTPGPSRRPA